MEGKKEERREKGRKEGVGGRKRECVGCRRKASIGNANEDVTEAARLNSSPRKKTRREEEAPRTES